MKISVMLLVFIVFFSTFYSSYCVPDFNYNIDKIHNDFDWQGTCKHGFSQSPINIDKSTLKSEKNSAYFDNYDKYISANISHEHHTVKFAFNNTEDVRFVSDRKVKYRLHSMHFHWGCTEHSINNKSYSMELHMVHYNPSIGSYSNVEQYSSQGLSVIGVLFEESKEDNPAINSILDMIASDSTRNKKVKYRDLLPSKLKHVYQYSGSLTTPPCYETVLWHVLDTKSTISLQQLDKFKRLAHYGYFMNCRPIRPLNGRKVSIMKVSDSSSAHSFMLKSAYYVQIWILLLPAFISKYLMT